MAGSYPRFSTRVIALLTLLLLGGLAPALARSAQPDDLGLTITFLTGDGAVSAHEPLLARIELVNNGKEEVSFPLLTSLEISNSAGKVVAAIPPPEASLDFMCGGHSLQPGEKYTKIWVISALYQFDTPGTYTLHVHWLQFQGGKLADLVAGTAEIRALPFDEARVTARCEEIYQPLYTDRKDGLEMGLRAHALYAVRHDLALPYLDWMAREWHDTNACYAIRQIGTPRATALLEVLVKRQDETGKAARAAMTMTHKTTMWNLGE